MNFRRLAFWYGVVAFVVAAVLVAPVSLPGVDVLGELVPRAVVPLFALLAAGYGVKVLATAAGEPPERPRPTRDDAAGVERVGADIDEAFDALGAGAVDGWARDTAARTLRAELRRNARAVLESRGHPPEEARRLLDAGAWTTDRRAAAFLGDEVLPLRTRVRDWASGEGRRRRAEAAVEELAALAEGTAGDDGPVPGRDDRRPAGDYFGDAAERTGGASTVEGRTELLEEVDA